MGIEDIATDIKGYKCMFLSRKKNTYNVLQYSPFTGEELSCSFLWELQLEVSEALSKRERDKFLLEQWCEMLYKMRPSFDINAIPDRLKFLVNDRHWFEIRKTREQSEHQGSEFCGGLSVFIDECYSYQSKLPKLAEVPIKFCPFCGIRLPSEFQEENWWEAWFKTFEWDKKHGVFVL